MRFWLPSLVLLLAACSDGAKDDTAGETDADTDSDSDTDTDSDTDSDTDTDTDVDAYEFESAFGGGSSVSYDGQTFRHLLIDDMKRYIGGLTDRLNEGELFPEPGEIEGNLLFYFEFDSDAYGSIEHRLDTDPATAQTTYDDVSSGKDLISKIAGNDEVGQHEDWSTDFVGWDEGGVTTPESLVRLWIAQIDAQSVAWAGGDIPLDPTGLPVPGVNVTPQGQDLTQLLEKFLRASVAFSQGADDYLDDDLDGKGLNADHTAAEEGKPFTALEHGWDEGFGYFGAARSYPAWSDEDIANTPAMDVDGDGSIDILTEINFGHSTNAAKRDLGSAESAPTDYTADAWEGFHGGRALLSQTAGQGLTAEQMVELQAFRDQAVLAWEKAIAASVVHYINATIQDASAFGTGEYSFEDHAKHWSEMKGFALSFQFNPRSPMSDEDFVTLHGYLRTAPELGDATARAAYKEDLLAARALLGATYGFDAANLGDDSGENGW